MAYRSGRASEDRPGVSGWACALLSVMIAAVGTHIAWRINSGDPEAAAAVSVAPPGVIASAGAPAPVAAPAAEPGPAGTPVPPLSPPGATVPLPPGAQPDAVGGPVEDKGPEWTRRPLPAVGPALLGPLTAMPPPMKPAEMAQALGRPPTTDDRPPTIEKGSEAKGQGRRTGAAAPQRLETPTPGRTGEQSVGNGEAYKPGTKPVQPARTVETPTPNTQHPTPNTPAAEPPREPTAETPLRVSLWASLGKQAQYRRDEWVVLRLAASAPCFAALYRVGPSGTIAQVLAPADKPAGSFGLAVKAGEHGTGKEWVVAVASARPLSASDVIALLGARGEMPDGGEAVQAVITYLQEQEPNGPPASQLESWQSAVAVTNYVVSDRSPAQTATPAPRRGETPAGEKGTGRRQGPPS